MLTLIARAGLVGLALLSSSEAFTLSPSLLPQQRNARGASCTAAPSLRNAKAGVGKAHMVASVSKVGQRLEGVPSTLREEFKFMIPDDGKTLQQRVADYVAAGELTAGDEHVMLNWMQNYKEALSTAPATAGEDVKFPVEEYFATLVELVHKERTRPHYFNDDKPTGQHYEEHNYCHPDSKFFDYQKFGVDFTRPLVDWPKSSLVGTHNLAKIKDQLTKGENVVFFSNHQSESDTHCIFTLFQDQLGPDFGKIASDIVFMAGERVLRDAIVVPFSRGCNLLTVYSKKHIDSEPELKTAKMSHNQRTMKTLGMQFAKGGTCMWFAPSGGRDRRSAETGKVEPAPFDPNSVQMVQLVAEGAGAKEKTHYYTMAMATHNIFPPPAAVGGEFGEERRVQYTQLGIAIGDEIMPASTEGLTKPQLKALRVERCQGAFDTMVEGYKAVGGYEQ